MKTRWIISLLIAVCVQSSVNPVQATALFGLVNTGEVFASEDGGVNWSVRATIPESNAIALAAGETSDELFAVTGSGILYRSVDAGFNWTAVGSVPATDVVDMLIRYNGTILLLTATGTLWRSADDGETFAAVATITASNLASLSTDVAGTLYALTKTGEIERSDDVGLSWNTVGTVTASDAVDILAVDFDLFVLTSTGMIANSTDRGDSWMFVGTVSHVHMRGLTRYENGLAALSFEGLLWTSPNGSEWSLQGSLSQVGVLAVGNDTPAATGIGYQVPPFSPLHVRSLWPNPAPGSVDVITVLFGLDRPGDVALRVYDVAGKLVDETAPQAFAQAGDHTIRWDVGGLPSGVYFVQLVAESGLKAQAKLAIVR